MRLIIFAKATTLLININTDGSPVAMGCTHITLSCKSPKNRTAAPVWDMGSIDARKGDTPIAIDLSDSDSKLLEDYLDEEPPNIPEGLRTGDNTSPASSGSSARRHHVAGRDAAADDGCGHQRARRPHSASGVLMRAGGSGSHAPRPPFLLSSSLPVPILNCSSSRRWLLHPVVQSFSLYLTSIRENIHRIQL